MGYSFSWLLWHLFFFLTFTIGDIFKNYLVEGIDIVSNDLMAILNSIDVSPIISSLLIDGAIAGIGGILAFLPNIFILFLALAVLEDSGYMSRVAYVMDSVMGKIGLSGEHLFLYYWDLVVQCQQLWHQEH